MRMLGMLGGGRLRRGQRQFHYKPCAHGRILLHADGAVMVFDNAAHDGQAQPGAAALGGEVRKEQLLLELLARRRARCRRSPPPPSLARDPASVEIWTSFTIASCMASAALSTRLARARFIELGSAMTGGSSGANRVVIWMPSSRPLNIPSASFTIVLILAGSGWRRGSGPGWRTRPPACAPFPPRRRWSARSPR